jgi:hypothetical protein
MELTDLFQYFKSLVLPEQILSLLFYTHKKHIYKITGALNAE